MALAKTVKTFKKGTRQILRGTKKIEMEKSAMNESINKL